MKFFSALSDAEFARAAFAAAGIDFETSVKAKNTDCLKSALAASKPTEALAEAERVMTVAKGENDDLRAQLASATAFKASAEKFTAVAPALETIGFKLDAANDANGVFSAAKLQEQHNLLVAKGARDMVARAGHPGVLDKIDADPTKKPEQKQEEKKVELTGEDRIRADFNKQIAKRNRAAGAN